MIISRVALLLALVAIGCLLPYGECVSGPFSRKSALRPDSAKIAVQHSAPTPDSPRAKAEPARSASRFRVTPASELRVASNQLPHVTATTWNNEAPAPFQLLPTEIKATTELIPGRWKARHRLLSEVFAQENQEPEPWISELQAPQLDWQARNSIAPREETISRRHWSARQ